MYDELVGYTAFDCWKDNFERVTKRYSISFESCADIACGTGLQVAYLCRLAGKVYGVDISSEMLEIARQRVQSDNVSFLEQSFTTLELPEKVELVTCNFDSLNYITRDEELAEAFRRFAHSLVRGGYAFFDMNTTRELASGWGDSVTLHRTPVGYSVWESVWDADARTNTVRMTNFLEVEGGLYEVDEEVHRERAYDHDFVLGLLRDAGFRSVESMDAKGLGSITKETRRVQFLARA